MEKTKPLADSIHRNNFKIFGKPASKAPGKGQLHMKSLKNDVDLFSRLYIGCQNRDGNLEEFFKHENQACPPALSDGGSIRLGVKSDLTCLEELNQPTSEAPPASCIVIDGAVIVQMLKPAAVKSFNEYAQEVFVPYILSKLQQVT